MPLTVSSDLFMVVPIIGRICLAKSNVKLFLMKERKVSKNLQDMSPSVPEAKYGELLLSATDMGVRFGTNWSIRHINLALYRRQIVTIIGPNGAGKSTTVKALLGLCPYTEGTVFRKEAIRIGYVPQKLSIDWTLPLTVMRFLKLGKKLSDTEITDVLSQVSAAHLAQSQIQSLSGGEFQRVLLARALLVKPDILVLDEPVQGVDYKGEAALYRLIRQMRDQLDCAVLLISHDLHIVMRETDHVVCLNGHVCCSGSPQKVMKSDDYRQLFGPTAWQENMPTLEGEVTIYRHDHDHDHIH